MLKKGAVKQFCALTGTAIAPSIIKLTITLSSDRSFINFLLIPKSHIFPPLLLPTRTMITATRSGELLFPLDE
ncbi:MAG TPA: hypothetical protein V6D43_25160 [Candidatus Sericytochromatia bacterium]